MRREAMLVMQVEVAISQRRACGLMAIDRGTCRYCRRKVEEGPLRIRLRELAKVRRRFGYRRLAPLSAWLSYPGRVCKNGAGTVEKTAVKPPWKTLRVSHFPTASTAAVLNLEVVCSKLKTRRMSHYPWTKVGGQVIWLPRHPNPPRIAQEIESDLALEMGLFRMT